MLSLINNDRLRIDTVGECSELEDCSSASGYLL